MKKNLTEIVFILDRSGSMSGLEADTIGGFNSMIEKQRKADGEALVSTAVSYTHLCWEDATSLQSVITAKFMVSLTLSIGTPTST